MVIAQRNEGENFMAKEAFNLKISIFTCKLDIELRKKSIRCYIWSIALYEIQRPEH